jgi:hypothetical protein
MRARHERRGGYYTPPAIARYLARWAKEPGRSRSAF